MVLLTRSAAKKAYQAEGSGAGTQATRPAREGTVVTVQTSATGLGVHKRWHYPEGTTNLTQPRGSNGSFSSSSSLSSLSDSDEDLSSNHSDLDSDLSRSGDLSVTSSTSNLRVDDPHVHLPPQTPIRPNAIVHKRSPLKRSPLIRWTTDGATDRFVLDARGNIGPDETFRMREEIKARKLEEVFEKQYAAMLRQKEIDMQRLQTFSDADSDGDVDVDDLASDDPETFVGFAAVHQRSA
ncbi:hypothetical protein ONZ45_g19193 [Pleurotus djamor]|nr:hypothetical protein ONZ45_g19193 [Pleurotus djamor]